MGENFDKDCRKNKLLPIFIPVVLAISSVFSFNLSASASQINNEAETIKTNQITLLNSAENSQAQTEIGENYQNTDTVLPNNQEIPIKITQLGHDRGYNEKRGLCALEIQQVEQYAISAYREGNYDIIPLEFTRNLDKLNANFNIKPGDRYLIVQLTSNKVCGSVRVIYNSDQAGSRTVEVDLGNFDSLPPVVQQYLIDVLNMHPSPQVVRIYLILFKKENNQSTLIKPYLDSLSMDKNQLHNSWKNGKLG
jgi:hypothetical protein